MTYFCISRISKCRAFDLSEIIRRFLLIIIFPTTGGGFKNIAFDYSRLGPLALPPQVQAGLRVTTDPVTGLPILIRGRAAEPVTVNRFKTAVENEVFSPDRRR